MDTIVFRENNDEEIKAAAEILKGGGIVAVPTETVYGLAASALRPDAVLRIFEVKGRPQDNPLILHVASPDGMDACCREIPLEAYELAELFWPGPLTIVLPKQLWVPDEVTAGLDTVAVRCPDSEVTRRIIRACGAPLAAPSANISGRPSTTTAEHVLSDMNGRIEAVVDCGECRVGLESTIVDLSVKPPRLLRPGGVTLSQLRTVLGEIEAAPEIPNEAAETERPKAPGMKYTHYAPRAPLVILEGEAGAAAEYVMKNRGEGTAVLCFDEERELFDGVYCLPYGPGDRPEILAKNLFSSLRRLDGEELSVIYARCPEGDGVAMAVRNRLMKAAGFKIIHV